MNADRLIPFLDEGLGNSSYLVDCGREVAFVVDPVRDATAYLTSAQQRGLTIAFALETHLHADFISGSRALASSGAEILAPAGSSLAFPHRALHDGDAVDVGELTIHAVLTPGHTPEHLCYLIRSSGEPVALFSGGALLPGAVARTDLISPDQTEPLARALHRSIAERLAPLPDDLIVYPTHGGGSFCSTVHGAERTTTIGRERDRNPVMSLDEDSFVEQLLSGFGSYPTYFLRLREVNRSAPSLHPVPPTLRRVPAEEAGLLISRGVEIVDVRPAADWAAGHIRGALSIELRPAFATWLGWLVDPERPLLFVLDDQQDRGQLVRECLKIGFEHLVGEIEGGSAAWRYAGLPEATVDCASVAGALTDVLDVRQDTEFAGGHLPGAFHVELGSIPSSIDRLPAGPVAVMCGHGERAATAASLLERAGHAGTRLLTGGPTDWARATGRPLDTGT